MNRGTAVFQEEDFHELPRIVEVWGRSLILTKDEAGRPVLLERICPHMGGIIEIKPDCLECPIHSWRFDFFGFGTNPRGRSLRRHALRQIGTEWQAEDPTGSPAREAALVGIRAKENLTIKLHAHACAELVYRGFSLLTDPWLEGPAFLGSWAHFPRPLIEASSLAPNAIWISHEHSDHLHPNTLRHFNRATPIYFPAFPNGRIERILASLGFTNLHPMRFGERVALSANIQVTVYEPLSLWNDAIGHFEFGNLSVLNLNDAGLNYRIAKYLPPTDVLLAGFATTASGYPATWQHLTVEQKREIYARRCDGVIQMLKEAVRLYRASHLLPFAAFTTLWHPDHQIHRAISAWLSVDDIRDQFLGEGVEVVNLLPGEAWDYGVGYSARRFSSEERLEIRHRAEGTLDAHAPFDGSVFEQFFPNDLNVSRAEVEAYFQRLNLIPEFRHCEDIAIRVEVLTKYHGACLFAVECVTDSGVLTVKPLPTSKAEILIRIPIQIMASITRADLSWDEAHIGYWCDFYRDPDVYHQFFWRLLQAPYYLKRPGVRTIQVEGPKIHRGSSLSAVHLGNSRARAILGRYGLYCITCDRGEFETIEHGGRFHGLAEDEIDRLVEDLNETAGE